MYIRGWGQICFDQVWTEHRVHVPPYSNVKKSKAFKVVHYAVRSIIPYDAFFLANLLVLIVEFRFLPCMAKSLTLGSCLWLLCSLRCL